MSWWDYGYQITAMANRTILVDNNTWNNTHISRVGQVGLTATAGTSWWLQDVPVMPCPLQAMASTEEKAYEIMRELDVSYVLVIFGGLTGYSSDGKGPAGGTGEMGVEVGPGASWLELLLLYLLAPTQHFGANNSATRSLAPTHLVALYPQLFVPNSTLCSPQFNPPTLCPQINSSFFVPTQLFAHCPQLLTLCPQINSSFLAPNSTLCSQHNYSLLALNSTTCSLLSTQLFAPNDSLLFVCSSSLLPTQLCSLHSI